MNVAFYTLPCSCIAWCFKVCRLWESKQNMRSRQMMPGEQRTCSILFGHACCPFGTLDEKVNYALATEFQGHCALHSARQDCLHLRVWREKLLLLATNGSSDALSLPIAITRPSSQTACFAPQLVVNVPAPLHHMLVHPLAVVDAKHLHPFVVVEVW